MQNFKHHLNTGLFRIVSHVAEETGTPVYIIGGYVRDLILGRPSKDIDFVTLAAELIWPETLPEG